MNSSANLIVRTSFLPLSPLPRGDTAQMVTDPSVMAAVRMDQRTGRIDPADSLAIVLFRQGLPAEREGIISSVCILLSAFP